jgi:hypoxanthine-guanine phosphoribosyltransferase
MQSDLERILFDEPTIQRRLDKIVAQISSDYRDRDLTVIAILNGSLIFMADLLRRVPLPLRSTIRVCVLLSKKKERARYVDADYSASKLKTSLWSATGSISRNSIAIFHTSGCCGRN